MIQYVRVNAVVPETVVSFILVKVPAGVIRTCCVLVEVTVFEVFLSVKIGVKSAVVAVSASTTYDTVSVPRKIVFKLSEYLLAV